MVLIIFEKCIQRIVSSKNPTHKKTTAVNHSYTKRHLANNSLVIIIIIIIIVLLLYSQFTLKCVVTKHLCWHHVIKSSSIKWTVDQSPSRLGSIPFAGLSIFYNNMNTLSRCKQRPCCVILTLRKFDFVCVKVEWFDLFSCDDVIYCCCTLWHLCSVASIRKANMNQHQHVTLKSTIRVAWA